MKFIYLSLVFFIAVSSYAQEHIFFKIRDGRDMLDFSNMSDISGDIKQSASYYFFKPFNPDNIDLAYYNLTITEGMIWGDMKIVQYDYKPKSRDRLRHVIWCTPELDTILKVEVYDSRGDIIYSGICFDNCRAKNAAARGDISHFYKGYYYIGSEKKEKSDILKFSDGLSEISIAAAPAGAASSSSKKSVSLGLNTYEQTIDFVHYAAKGSATYKTMEEFIKLIASGKLNRYLVMEDY